MKKTSSTARKLLLSVQKVRNLDDRALAGVGGGMGGFPTAPCNNDLSGCGVVTSNCGTTTNCGTSKGTGGAGGGGVGGQQL